MFDSVRCHLETYTSDVSGLRHWRLHTRTSYICPMVFDVSSTLWFAFTILCNASANHCFFHQWASDLNDLAYVTGSVPQDGSALNAR